MARPGKFVCPPNFVEEVVNGDLFSEDLESEDVELWLMQSPANVDTSLFERHHFQMDGACDLHIDDNNTFTCTPFKFDSRQQERDFCVVVPSRNGDKLSVVTKPFQGCFLINQKVVYPKLEKRMVCEPNPSAMPVFASEKLKQRFVPFGCTINSTSSQKLEGQPLRSSSGLGADPMKRYHGRPESRSQLTFVDQSEIDTASIAIKVEPMDEDDVNTCNGTSYHSMNQHTFVEEVQKKNDDSRNFELPSQTGGKKKSKRNKAIEDETRIPGYRNKDGCVDVPCVKVEDSANPEMPSETPMKKKSKKSKKVKKKLRTEENFCTANVKREIVDY